MITEILGIIQMPHADDILHRIKNIASYKVAHRIDEFPFESGIMASVLIGNEIRENVSKSDKDLTVLADATLYNKESLSEELNPDEKNVPSILTAAYRKWGYQCVNHLKGDFAFIVWDNRKKELFCARDHIGIRPFYYLTEHGGFAFSSELRLIKEVFPQAPEENSDFFLDTLVTAISDTSSTPFKKIFRLPPAHYLIFRNGKIKIQKYWQPDLSQMIRYSNSGDYFLHFRNVLFEAVKARCEGSENIGSELSGGLDSSAITGIAAELAKKKPFHLTALSNTLPEIHDNDLTDEKDHIIKQINFSPVTWIEINRSDENIPGLIKDAVDIQGCYSQQRFHIFNSDIYKASGKSGIHVLLSGFGGDELSSARTGISWNDLIAEKQWEEYVKALRYNTGYTRAFIKGIKHLAKYYSPIQKRSAITAGIFTPQLLTGRFESLPLQKKFSEGNNLKARSFKKHEREKQIFLSQRQSQKISHPHIPQRIEYSYAAAAQYGIQYRYPLFDIDLIQTCLSFPAWVKTQPGTDRYLFRQAIREIVPEDIRNRSDKSVSVIPYMNQKFRDESQQIVDFIEECSQKKILTDVFDYPQFKNWYHLLAKRDSKELIYLMPGAFYNYLMLLIFKK